ncbi:valine--tRNA ligase [Sphingosinicella sp. YJ22]|uniref:valine--tRNA ligase n=1 Tax=Sphingosinicella sp. YJ22 TaxID=1104780 RepID=UPI0014074457|nr:valine--tRNA ligase [Sphingosinicella sp. YJ22]
MTELPKTFDPAAIEGRWYSHWEENGLFRPERPDAEPWTIVNPPPNVTGSLHIGHALDNTLQDILTRHERLRGKDALWVVGTDHAGIATQMVVERNLESQGLKRQEMGREAFLEHVWEWKAQSGGQITRQLRRLGCSMDWSREQFTMDPHFVRAVNKVFVQLYREGLLYRDKRLVNWDPRFGTAISDLEVETKEVQGKFWHLKYPLEDGSGFIHVATTRPETMLADMAVAVHPDDARYRDLVGKRVRLPITGRLIPIIRDEHADPELGSGAVKITPGHDFNDFEVGKRAGFKAVDMLNMLDGAARVMQTQDGLVPAELIGMDRFDARKRVVELLEEGGFLERIEDKVIQLPYGDRSGVVIEPWLTDQWYVDAETLSKPAIDAVREGKIKVVPKSWEKTWYNWLENIQPWCVSRQLWWGHRIPAWYDDQGNVFVAETEEEAQREAGNRPLRRDDDVLDTWFSSGLWPFATLGWPDDTELLRRHYPNDVLISGFDIIFFWDARMAMQGLHFMKDVPWKTLYLHGLVRDSKGQKMSKSKGNTVDPLGLIDRYGADALRFTLAAMESQGRDIKLDEKRVEGYRNFATKLWNATRFCQANGIGASDTIEPPAAQLPVNRWIIGETVKTVQALDLALAELRFDESSNTIYHFVWATFCDWYLELIKGAIDEETRKVAGWVLDQILVMLHPFMPFVTEELWNALGERPYELILAKWPMPDARALDPEAGPEIDWLIRVVSGIRTARAELNVPPGARLPLHVRDAGSATQARLQRHAVALQRLARIETISDGEASGGAAQIVVDEATYVLPLEGVIDIEAEKARLQKAAEAAEKERDSLAGRLNNPSFVERAKPEAVDKARADHAEKASDAEKYRAALARLG